MKKDIIEILDFEEGKNKVGRPRLADAKTKRKSLIIACISFFSVILLLIFGYGTLFGINMNKLLGNVNNNNSKKENILITDINPIVKDITLKENTIRKVYLTVLPADSTNKTIRYKSADKNIATVDENGRVRAIKEGNTIIYAYTTDGSLKKASFNIKVIKDVKAECNFTSISKASDRLNYNIECKNAKVKQIEYKTLNDDYKKIDSKKLSDSILFSKEQLENDITLKVVYYPNNSKITKYQTKTIKEVKQTKKIDGNCTLTIKEVNTNSAKYDITCNNATVNKIAYKIGDGSYVGIDESNLADTILFEESDVTRIIYFNVSYVIDGTNNLKSITKNGVIQKKVD
mgnify:FL=1